MPATHLISTVLPAPLSPHMHVTAPAGTSRSTSISARTAPKCLEILRSERRGAAAASAISGTAAPPSSLLNARCLAGGGDVGGAELRRLHELVLDHRGGGIG